LCSEFGFTELSAQLSEFRSSPGRIAALEEKLKQHDRAISVLPNNFAQFLTDFNRLAGEVSTQRSGAAGIPALCSEVSALKTQLAEMSELRREVSILWRFPAVPRVD
jgi:hypothetical protein